MQSNNDTICEFLYEALFETAYNSDGAVLSRAYNSIYNVSAAGYADHVDYAKALIAEANQMGLDITDVNTIMLDWQNSIANMKTAYTLIVQYKTDKSDTGIWNYISKAYNEGSDATSYALTGYYKYYNLVQHS